MVKADVVVRNKTGLHLRPAGALAKAAMEFECSIQVQHGSTVVDAKSMLGLLSACIRENDEITVICNGPDEETALNSIIDLINNELCD